MILGLVLILIACLNSQQTTTENLDVKFNNILTYFKDERTGLCFATTSSYTTYGTVVSITCVPCDSLKKIKIGTIK